MRFRFPRSAFLVIPGAKWELHCITEYHVDGSAGLDKALYTVHCACGVGRNVGRIGSWVYVGNR